MSVIVKGMEMHKGCLSCFVKAGWCPAIRKRMEEASRSDRWIPENYRHDDCPLVEVPPHGRLIDADELIAKQEEDAEIFMGSTNYGDKVRYDEAMNSVANIVNAPTVIPADKDGET